MGHKKTSFDTRMCSTLFSYYFFTLNIMGNNCFLRKKKAFKAVSFAVTKTKTVLNEAFLHESILSQHGGGLLNQSYEPTHKTHSSLVTNKRPKSLRGCKNEASSFSKPPFKSNKSPAGSVSCYV